jgi:hypothetical protein
MGEYHYFFTERVTSYLLVAAYGVIGDAPVRGEELVMGCFQNGSLVEAYYLRTFPVITYTSFYCTPEV